MGKKIAIFLFFIFFNLSFVSCAKFSYGEKIEKDNYIVSRDRIGAVIESGEMFYDYIEFTNLIGIPLSVSFTLSGELDEIFSFEEAGLIIGSKNISRAEFVIKGKGVGNYTGFVILDGDIQETIPVNVSVVEDLSDFPLVFDISLNKQKFVLDSPFSFKLNVNNLKSGTVKNVSFNYSIIDSSNRTYLLGREDLVVSSSFQKVKTFNLPSEVGEGEYILITSLLSDGEVYTVRSRFLLVMSFFKRELFGLIPMWLLFILLGVLFLSILIFYLVRKHIEQNKKYRMNLDLKSLAKKSPDALFLGKIAEKNDFAYLEPNRLMTHSIIAGATGGGKSISAQVVIEEALLHNVAVLVFDPTAQWSGMLRKCTDKRMFAYYPAFGLKESDAKAFKGNVRQVKDARELIEIGKYIHPGQIHIFSLNKLDPSNMDTFVANVIRQIFKSDPKESPDLKVILVFDEVHRLLSKFGGSGEGFLQIERACREFRKWGIGVMLVSQVLSDFVGEIKANISTEMQMRTRDEGDLGRIKTKYGEDFLKSLVKASVGVGLFVNPAYNHAQPYFINFRPILHNTRRLSDEELEKYNKYNEIVDDLEYEIEQLETEKVDTFDLKMELKLVKDKVMTGNFSVVEIYLEGLTPRVAKEWERLGKKPKKRELKLVDVSEIKKSIEEAKKSREKFEKEEEKNKPKEEVKVKKEDISIKEVKALTFDNGLMVSSLKELLGVLENLDNEIFSIHVNNKKNDIATWVGENFDKNSGDILKSIVDKKQLTEKLKEFVKNGSLTETKKDEKAGESSGKKEGDKKKDSEEKKEVKEGKAEEKKEKKEIKKGEDKVTKKK